MATLPKQYDPKISESHWQKRWEEMGVYAFRDDKPKAETFVIDTPPPTVSGVLHMGHIFSYTQADFIARYKRMRGFDVFYPMGFDDNGLPTERLVEKTKKIRAIDMSREAFIAECLSVSKEARDEFRKLFTSSALSVDWNQEYNTISDASRRLSQLSFLDLVKNNHCYRTLRPFYWDPIDQTAIASAEIEDKDLASNACDIIFTVEGTPLTVMTTRPELLPACVALFCHPEDSRYNHLHNKQAEVPLFNFPIPILTDVTVSPEKGTGLMMCCTFGDDADILKWQKHQLPTKVIINKYGRINFPDADGRLLSPPNHEGIMLALQGKPLEIAEKIQGKKISNSDTKHPGAREIIIEELKASGLLVKQTPITHTVKCAERSGAPLEILPTQQWFISVIDKKLELTARAQECKWNPEWMRLRIEQWIEGLNQDWCISRQRYFGVTFPVWYESEKLNTVRKIIYASPQQLPINPLVDLPTGYKDLPDGADAFLKTSIIGTRECINPDGKRVFLHADLDVMDTWATSSITPQISAHGINPETALDKKRYEKLFPADLRPQAHEIIRTWAFYTIAKAHLHSDMIPWKNIMISGWCLAADKTKMSKSKGNVVTPVALIEDKGADAVRYWASTSRLATDTAFSEDLLKIGKKLVGKIWNASNLIAQLPTTNHQPSTIEPLDRWILSRLHVAVTKATEAFEQFEYCDARVAIEDFFWNDFCDNYLELVKARAYNEGKGQASALTTLQTCLETVLRLFAPFVPHVTEEIYSHLFAEKGSVNARGKWPVAADYAYDAEAEKAGSAAVEILEIIRKAKSEAAVSIKAPVALVMIFVTDKSTVPFTGLAGIMDDLKAAGSVHEVVKSPKEDLPYTTRDGAYRISVELAKVEDIKRNADHAEHEKLEGKVLSAPGKPDLSKQVVKMQVQDLATTIQRQK